MLTKADCAGAARLRPLSHWSHVSVVSHSPAGAGQGVHAASLLADVNHGFSLFPVNVNFQIVPGYDYALL